MMKAIIKEKKMDLIMVIIAEKNKYLIMVMTEGRSIVLIRELI